MKVVKADFQILERDEQRGGLAIIEAAGRTCYKSEGNIGPGSAERFVANCIRRKHEAMLEHGDYIFTFDDKHIYDNRIRAWSSTGPSAMLSMKGWSQL